jgi:hypothetical protein
MKYSIVLLAFLAASSVVCTKPQKQTGKNANLLRYDEVLDAIRAHPKLSNREKYDLQLNLNKAFQIEKERKKQEQRKKQEALERKKLEEKNRKLSAIGALKDFHSMRYL